MGIGRFFKRLVDSEVCGEEMIATQIKCYATEVARNPSSEPHAILFDMWGGRMYARGRFQIDQAVKTKAYVDTSMFACLPFPDNARALGLWFIAEERPDIIQQYPKFNAEFLRLMAPVYQTVEDDTFFELYRKHNPTMASDS